MTSDEKRVELWEKHNIRYTLQFPEQKHFTEAIDEYDAWLRGEIAMQIHMQFAQGITEFDLLAIIRYVGKEES